MTALLIYEDFQSATRSKAILERAVERAAPNELLDLKMWRRDVLYMSSAAAEALVESRNAVIVVLAIRQPETPPFTLMAWLEKWAVRRYFQDAALLVLHGRHRMGNGSHANPDLSRLAGRHGLSLLTDGDSDEGRPNHIGLEPMAHTFMELVTRKPRSRSMLGWGINE
jgi:hypothetical protein